MLLRLLTVGLLLLMPACASGGAGNPSPSPSPSPGISAAPSPGGASGSSFCVDSVTIQDNKASPPRLTVKAPCAVLFTNRDDRVMQIQGPDFQLGEMGKDQSWAHTYRDPGEFEWFDAKDPSLRGVIVVQP